MKLLFIGDIYGRVGRRVCQEHLPALRKEFDVDLIVANVENLAGGVGVTPPALADVQKAGVDGYTSGNHIWDKKEVFQVFENSHIPLVRPLNYPEGLPGKTKHRLSADGRNIWILCAQGRVFMEPIECPFLALSRTVEEIRHIDADALILVDFHAEATSEKIALGWYLDGQVSAVLGTHTHVQTSDETILPEGTAYITDAGMTGPHDSVIGVKKEVVIERFLTAGAYSRRFDQAKEKPQINGVLIEFEKSGFHAKNITRIKRHYD